MRQISKETLKHLREQYPAGTRIELVKMEDPQAPPVGTRGTVKGVDDIGSIMVAWDTGSRLSLVYEEDECRIIVGEFTDKVRDQILAIRDTGRTNMFDVNMVQRIASEMDFHELVIFLIDHRKEYVHFIMTGERQ